MRNKYGKIFQNIRNREIVCFSYNPEQDYYAMVQKHIKEGYQQTIFTSSVMLSLAESFLLFHEAIVMNIEFVSEDESLDEEISTLIQKMKVNRAFWVVLKERLEFLSKYDSIDIKRIELKSKQGVGFLVTLQLNGIITVSENAYDIVTKSAEEVIRRVIN